MGGGKNVCTEESLAPNAVQQEKKKKKKNHLSGVPIEAVETNPASIHEVVGLISGLAQWVGDLVWP